MKNSKHGTRSDEWRWWIGGGVIALAAVIGCATAVDYRKEESRHKQSEVKQSDRGLAGEPVNGGKAGQPPWEVSFEGEDVITVKKNESRTLQVKALADLRRISGWIEGTEGLKGVNFGRIERATLNEGKSYYLPLTIPPYSGDLIVHLTVDHGDPKNLQTTYYPKNLKVIGTEAPKTDENGSGGGNKVGFAALSTGPGANTTTQVDSNGTLVQPMESK